MRNLSPLKLDHACVYVVYMDAYDTFKQATGTGVGVVAGVVDVVVGAGVVVVVRAALVVVDDVGDGVVVVEVRNDAVVSTNTKLVALLALTDTFVPLTKTGTGVVVMGKLGNDAVVSTNSKRVALLALTDTFVPLTKTGTGVVVVRSVLLVVDVVVGAGVVVAVSYTHLTLPTIYSV